MRKILEIIVKFCNRWELTINVNKSKLMEMDRDEVEPMKIEQYTLEGTNKYKYLGVDISSNSRKWWEYWEEKVIKLGRGDVNLLRVWTKKSCCKGLVGTRIWENMVLPKISYALDVLPIRGDLQGN